jgi:hypothetical protein
MEVVWWCVWCVITGVRNLEDSLKLREPPSYLSVLEQAVKLASVQGDLPLLFCVQHSAECRLMFRAGFINPTNGKSDQYLFVAPLMRMLLVQILGRRASVPPARLSELVLGAIQAIRQSALQALPVLHVKINKERVPKLSESSFSTVCR